MATSWLFRAIFAGSLGAGLAACTLLTGVGDLSVDETAADAAPDVIVVPHDSGNPLQDSAPTDAGPILGDETAAPVVDACSPTGCLPVPDGFTLVAVGAQGAACPGGYDGGVDGLIDPGVDPSACGCTCTITNGGHCPSSGTITQFNSAPDAGAVCTTQIGTLSGGGCQTDGYQGPFITQEDRKYIPPAATPFGLACGAGNSTKDTSKSGGAGVRVCPASVSPQCNGLVCAGDPGGGFKACIGSQTATACPAEWPVVHHVGSGIAFDCDNAGCGCAGVTGTCVGGNLAFYPTADCSGAAGFSAPVNSNCLPTSATAGGPYSSHLYQASPPVGLQCTTNGTANVVNVFISDATLVCCTQ